MRMDERYKMTSEAGPGNDVRPPLRADARRNHDRILRIAAERFSSQGTEVSLEEIAKAAGVGQGTLYRHFPSREALLAATLQGRQLALHSCAEQAKALPDADAALREWLRALQDFLQTFSGLPSSVLAVLREDSSPLGPSREALIATTGEFLARAQTKGLARASVTANDLFLSTLAVAWVLDRAEAYGTTRAALERVLAHGYLNGDPSATALGDMTDR